MPPPPIEVLERHDFEGLNPRRLQWKLGTLVNAPKFGSFRDALSNLPEAGRSPVAHDPFVGIETCDSASARHRSMTGGGPLACLRAQLFDHARKILASEYVSM